MFASSQIDKLADEAEERRKERRSGSVDWQRSDVEKFQGESKLGERDVDRIARRPRGTTSFRRWRIRGALTRGQLRAEIFKVDFESADVAGGEANAISEIDLYVRLSLTIA